MKLPCKYCDGTLTDEQILRFLKKVYIERTAEGVFVCLDVIPSPDAQVKTFSVNISPVERVVA